MSLLTFVLRESPVPLSTLRLQLSHFRPCTYRSWSALLKRGRICRKLLVRSSLGCDFVRLIELFSLRLRKPCWGANGNRGDWGRAESPSTPLSWRRIPGRAWSRGKRDRSPDTSLPPLLPRVLYDVSKHTNTHTSLEEVGGLVQEVGAEPRRGKPKRWGHTHTPAPSFSQNSGAPAGAGREGAQLSHIWQALPFTHRGPEGRSGGGLHAVLLPPWDTLPPRATQVVFWRGGKGPKGSWGRGYGAGRPDFHPGPAY